MGTTARKELRIGMVAEWIGALTGHHANPTRRFMVGWENKAVTGNAFETFEKIDPFPVELKIGFRTDVVHLNDSGRRKVDDASREYICR